MRAILAGSDVLLVFTDWKRRSRPARGRELAACRFRESTTRSPVSCGQKRGSVFIKRTTRVNLDDLARTSAARSLSAPRKDIADRGVTLLRDTPQLLPLDATRPARPAGRRCWRPRPCPGLDFERELRGRGDSLQAARGHAFRTVDSIKVAARGDYDVMIVAVFVRVTDRKASIGLPAIRRRWFIDRWRPEKPVLVVCFGSPYLVADFPEAKTWLAAFSTADVAQRAAARAMFGQIAIGGRIPVTVPGVISWARASMLPRTHEAAPAGAAAMTRQSSLAQACTRFSC